MTRGEKMAALAIGGVLVLAWTVRGIRFALERFDRELLELDASKVGKRPATVEGPGFQRRSA